MYVDVRINGMSTLALVNTKAIHNFISGAEVRRLGLALEKDSRKIKTVNAEARPMHKVPNGFHVKVGHWSSVANFTATLLDDFKMILGMDFLIAAKAVPMSNLGVVSFIEEDLSYMMKVVRGEPSKEKAISAIQLKEDSKREMAYLAVLKMKDYFEEKDLPSKTKGATKLGTSKEKHVVDCERGRGDKDMRKKV
ncbi:hypothetical protein M6B38_323260 [Iris pallida]|uniref:Uncharacterized protein n=1 Tax=Iris pallida TaxID=29817 RepID=A0AAX6HA31_IRIPA|nr:hypothetical protein M6B38_323260 [Iris pallida]